MLFVVTPMVNFTTFLVPKQSSFCTKKNLRLLTATAFGKHVSKYGAPCKEL
jgi:hypothetical protein